jgi:hypothetical protein
VETSQAAQHRKERTMNVTTACHQTPAPQLPRSTRLGAALASVLITTTLLGSVVVGLTAMADEATALAARPAAAAART